MELIKDKRGIAAVGLFVLIFIALFAMVFLAALSFGMGKADEALSEVTGSIGNNSIQEAYQNTLKRGIISMQTTVPQIISTGILLGMVILMIIVAYNVKRTKQVWAILDIGIIIVAEILSVIVKTVFINYMNISEEYLEIFREILPLGAKYILNLPIYIPIIGTLIIVATYIVTKDKEDDGFR